MEIAAFALPAIQFKRLARKSLWCRWELLDIHNAHKDACNYVQTVTNWGVCIYIYIYVYRKALFLHICIIAPVDLFSSCLYLINGRPQHVPLPLWWQWFSVGLDMYAPLTVWKFSQRQQDSEVRSCVYIYMCIFKFKKKDGIIQKRKRVMDRNKKCYPQKMMSSVQKLMTKAQKLTTKAQQLTTKAQKMMTNTQIYGKKWPRNDDKCKWPSQKCRPLDSWPKNPHTAQSNFD